MVCGPKSLLLSGLLYPYCLISAAATTLSAIVRLARLHVGEIDLIVHDTLLLRQVYTQSDFPVLRSVSFVSLVTLERTSPALFSQPSITLLSCPHLSVQHQDQLL